MYVYMYIYMHINFYYIYVNLLTIIVKTQRLFLMVFKKVCRNK